MSVTPSSTIVGVFSDQAAAEQAVNALYNAGFRQEDIQYLVPGTSGSFFEGLKNFLTGTNDSSADLAGDLTNMGLADTEAQYYANEYHNGKPILIVRAADRRTEAMTVLRQYGAYNTQTEAVDDTQQPTTYTQQGDSTADMQSSSDYTQQSSYGAPGQYDNVQNLETQPQTHTGEEYPDTAAQPGNATPEYNLTDQDARAQDMQTDSYTPGPAFNTDNSASGTDTAMREQDSEPLASALPSAAPQEYGVYQDAQASETASEPEQDYSSQADQVTGYDSQPQQSMQTTSATSDQETETQPEQAGAAYSASPEQTDELEQLQAQLQALQQQLQDAKARLSAAKEQENQVKTARERQQRLQSTRQQLQDAQSELQATLAELQEVQSRIVQYQ